jgi:hypothetical protein
MQQPWNDYLVQHWISLLTIVLVIAQGGLVWLLIPGLAAAFADLDKRSARAASLCLSAASQRTTGTPTNGPRNSPSSGEMATRAAGMMAPPWDRLRLWALFAWTLPPSGAGVLLYLFGVIP